MAFCNACGSTIEAFQKFCPKCGAANPGASTAATGAISPATSRRSSKTILILVVVFAGIIVLGLVAASLVAWQLARHTHVETNGEGVKVETPLGTVETSQSADHVARSLGVDVYPGAKALADNAASVTMGAMKTINAEFETSDSIDKVADFYRQHYPNAIVTVKDKDQYTIVSTSKDSAVTIHLEPRQGRTHITIANVSGLPMGKHS